MRSSVTQPRVVFDIEATALSPTKGSVIAIGVLKTSEQGEQSGRVFSTKGRVTDPATGEVKPKTEEEHRIIKEFVEYISGFEAPIYGYNSDGYDFGFLIGRAMNIDDYGDTVDQLFQLKEEYGVDLMKKDIARRPNGYPYSLEDLLEKHGFEHNGEISGGDVPRYFKEGKTDTIAEYLKEDVKKTDKLIAELL